MRNTLVLLFLLITTQLIADSSFAMQQVADGIVRDLYEVVGDRVLPRPSVEISDKQDAGARFDALGNTIFLEKKLYHICTSFGEDSLSALAFVLGHELGHFYERKNGESYLAHHHHVKAELVDEYIADVHGVFNAYLAGYKTVALIPDLIDRIYQVYNLKGQKLHGYPDLAERKATAQLVLDEVKKLIHAFELANYLSVIGEYRYAATTYEFVLEQYKGREIHNNLGVVYLLEALNFTEKNYSDYLYPVEIDSRTRLKKPGLGGGEKDLDPEARRYQLKLLEKARKQFEKAARLDPYYIIDDINKVCVLLLMGDIERANHHYLNKLDNRISFLANSTEYGNVLLIKALLHLAKDEPTEAASVWTQLESHTNKTIALQASYNLSILNKDAKQALLISEACSEAVLLPQTIDSAHKLGGNNTFNLDIDTRLSVQQQAKSVVYTIECTNNYNLVFKRNKTLSGKRVHSDTPLLSISTQDGFYLYCPNHNTVGLLSATSHIVEWGQLYKIN